MKCVYGKYLLVVAVFLLHMDQVWTRQCEKVRIPFCKGVGYNTTFYPNLLSHDNQDEAMSDSLEFNSLVDTNCSPEIALFLCSIYAPVCTQMSQPLRPCRSLCESARSGCESLMVSFGYSWPAKFECSKFPPVGLCVQRNRNSAKGNEKKSKKGGKKSSRRYRRRKCSKQTEKGKLCCKLGRRAAKKGYYCNLKKEVEDKSTKTIRFRKNVVRKCSLHTSCFRSCCEAFRRKRRNNNRNARRNKRKN